MKKSITQYVKTKILYLIIISLCTFIGACGDSNKRNTSQDYNGYIAKGYRGWNTLWYVNGMPCLSGNVSTEIQKGTNVVRCVAYKYTDFILEPAHDFKFIELIPGKKYPKQNIIWSSKDEIKDDKITEIDETFTFYSNNDIKPLWSYYDEIDSSYYAQTNEILDIAESFIKALCHGDKNTVDEYFSKKDVNNTVIPFIPFDISPKTFIPEAITLDMTNTQHVAREEMKIVFGNNTVLIYADNNYLWGTQIINNEKVQNNKFFNKLNEMFNSYEITFEGEEVTSEGAKMTLNIDKIILAREDDTWKILLHP